MSGAAKLSLMSDEQIWLQKLKTDFYFSGEEAQHLKDRMRVSSYSEVYDFCFRDPVEYFKLDTIFKYAMFSDYSSEIEAIENEIDKLGDNRRMHLISCWSNKNHGLVHPGHLVQLNADEKKLYDRMCNTPFNYDYDNIDINPRRVLISRYVTKRIVSLLIANCLKGRYWFEVKHAHQLENCIATSGSVKSDYIVKIFQQRHESSVEMPEEKNTKEAAPALDVDALAVYMPFCNNNPKGLNFLHLKALMLCHFEGLVINVDDLRNQTWFNDDCYRHALVLLMKDNNKSAREALIILHELKLYQVKNLVGGTRLDDVKAFSNEQQANAFIKFRQQGLTIDRVSKLGWFSKDIHAYFLKILLKHMDIDRALLFVEKNPHITSREQCNAIDIILASQSSDDVDIIVSQLNFWQAKCLINKIAIVEVINLNEVQAHALCILYNNGLRREHLRGQDWFSCPYHKDVLAYLIRKLKLSVDDALDVIKETSWIKILIMMKRLCRLDLENLNTFQMMALIKLNQFGLEKEHLVGCAWFNSATQRDRLVCYMTVEKREAVDAMKLLQSDGDLLDPKVVRNDTHPCPSVKP